MHLEYRVLIKARVQTIVVIKEVTKEWTREAIKVVTKAIRVVTKEIRVVIKGTNEEDSIEDRKEDTMVVLDSKGEDMVEVERWLSTIAAT